MEEMNVNKCFEFSRHCFAGLSPGLPDRLPDAVCPAAVLQHVLRPPQHRRETNPAVYRPLAPPPAAPTRPLSSKLCPVAPSLMRSWWIYNTAKKEEEWDCLTEEGNRVKRDGQALTHNTAVLWRDEGLCRCWIGKKVRDCLKEVRGLAILE